jgi:hypothetical protein
MPDKMRLLPNEKYRSSLPALFQRPRTFNGSASVRVGNHSKSGASAYETAVFLGGQIKERLRDEALEQ